MLSVNDFMEFVMRSYRSHARLLRIFRIIALCFCMAACAKTPTAGNSSPPASQRLSNQTAIEGNVCDLKLLSAADAASILGIPIMDTRPLAGDAQTCYFVTARHKERGNDLRVSLRPGLGVATIQSYTSGHMNEYAKWAPLAGVGESAVWQPDSHEIEAQSNNVLCNASFGFESDLFRTDPAIQQQKLAAVCNRIFAALKLAAPTAAASAHPTAGGNIVAAACDREITPADIADLITAAVEKRYASTNAQSCSYHASAGATVTISLATGDDAKFAWDIASNPANGQREPIAGIGDSALGFRSGTDVVARKGGLVCSVDITGTDNVDGMQVVTKARGLELAKKLGALCSKVFAARSA